MIDDELDVNCSGLENRRNIYPVDADSRCSVSISTVEVLFNGPILFSGCVLNSESCLCMHELLIAQRCTPNLQRLEISSLRHAPLLYFDRGVERTG